MYICCMSQVVIFPYNPCKNILQIPMLKTVKLIIVDKERGNELYPRSADHRVQVFRV